PLGEALLVGDRRPRRGEALVGDPAEQHRLGVAQLLELVGVAVGAALELERPAARGRALGSARILHHAVERDELRYHDPSHFRSSRTRVCWWGDPSADANSSTLGLHEGLMNGGATCACWWSRTSRTWRS